MSLLGTNLADEVTAPASAKGCFPVAVQQSGKLTTNSALKTALTYTPDPDPDLAVELSSPHLIGGYIYNGDSATTPEVRRITGVYDGGTRLDIDKKFTDDLSASDWYLAKPRYKKVTVGNTGASPANFNETEIVSGINGSKYYGSINSESKSFVAPMSYNSNGSTLQLKGEF